MCKIRGSDDSDYESNIDTMLSVRNLPLVEPTVLSVLKLGCSWGLLDFGNFVPCTWRQYPRQHTS